MRIVLIEVSTRCYSFKFRSAMVEVYETIVDNPSEVNELKKD